MSKTQTETQTPTANGVIKGRPGKGRVLSLEQRARCYAGHKMTEENTFRYTAKRAKGKPKPIERAWCKKCRAISRKASATARRLREAQEERARQREVKAQLRQALPKLRKAAKPKARKAAKAKAKAATPRKARKAATTRKVSASAAA